MMVLFGFDPGSLVGATSAGPSVSTQYGTSGSATSGASTNLATECQTGADANTRPDCRAVGYVNSIQAYWSQYFSSQGSTYTPAKTVIYTGSIQGACGYATAATGPFYCPVDGKVYVDLSFFTDMQSMLGVNGTNFAEGYVLAHEYGHHVQDLLGALSSSQQQGATGGSVRTELQADCLAGVWANHAASTGYLTPLSSQETQQALDAAAAVGDDRLQQQSQGRVTPDSFTHGTSAQRQHWFQVGEQSGDLKACDTSGKL